MDKTLEELKAEADVLGIEYNKNIGQAKLNEKVEAYYESQAAGDSVKVQVEKPEEKKEVKGKIDAESEFRRQIIAAKEAAFKTKIVTITNNDTRENSVLTADYFSFENQHFGRSLLVPFNIAVELPQGIIDVINSTRVTLHMDEILNGQRTGNKVTKTVKKYNVSYEEVK